MNIILSQKDIIGIDPEWILTNKYAGKCNILVVLIYDKNDIVDISNIKYKKLYVIIVNTYTNKKNIQTVISLTKIILRCDDTDIFLESDTYCAYQILRDIKIKSSICGFWIASGLMACVLLVFCLFVVFTIYEVLYKNE